MKTNSLKYIPILLIVLLLILLNIDSVKKAINGDSDNIAFDIKTVIIPTDEEIIVFLDSIFIVPEKRIVRDPIELNKRIILKSDLILGYVYIIHEKIPCPNCSDINFMLITDEKLIIKHIKYLRPNIEDNKVIAKDYCENYAGKFLNRSLVNGDFDVIKNNDRYQKFTYALTKSIVDLKEKVRLFNEIKK